MKLSRIAVIAGVAMAMVGCSGQWDRTVATVMGVAKTCVDGVTYLQFTSGATVQVDTTGKPVACK